jgi:hypothetical protein
MLCSLKTAKTLTRTGARARVAEKAAEKLNKFEKE